MAADADSFFETLRSRRHEPLLEHAQGTLRFDLGDDGDRWLVTVDRGAVEATRAAGKADCTVRVGRKLLGAIVRGDANATTALLRGALSLEGDLELFVRFQRLFGAPAAPAREPESIGVTRA